jgi:outer membrane protein TolC
MKILVGRFAAAAVVTVATLFPSLARGQAGAESSGEAPLPPFPVFTGETITLEEALRIALEHVPNIQLQREDALSKRGLAREASGAFDATLVGDISTEYNRQEVSESIKRDERNKREELRQDAIDLGALEDAAGQRAAEFENALSTLQDDGDLHAVDFSSIYDQADWDLLVGLLETSDPEVVDEVRTVIGQWVTDEANASVAERDDAHTQRLEAEKLLRNLGTVPDYEKVVRGNLNLELRKKYRTGITLTPFLQVNAGGTNYLDKPRSAEFGGKGVDDNYKSIIGFRVTVPLARGRGPESASAAERAADVTYRASLAATTHAAATSLHEAILAYWQLAAAQEQLAAFEWSMGLSNQLLEISRALAGRQIPAVEVGRAQARAAEARARVEQGRRGLHEARLAFARKIGLAVSATSEAPLAADEFPAAPDSASLAGLDSPLWQDQAIRTRQDYKSATLMQWASNVLMRGAAVDVRPVADLEVELSASGLDENNTFLEGFRGAFGPYTGPGAKVSLLLDWPLSAGVQGGRHVQRQAFYRQQQITARDLERTIRSNVLFTIGSLRESAQQVADYEEAVRLYRQSVENEVRKLRDGRSTVIDAITTEQRLLDAETALVASRQQLAQTLASFRFETGTLVEEQPDGGWVRPEAIMGLPAPGPSSR